jgi:hypothetical protein
MINVQNISSKLASLPDQALKQYAEMHKDDPYVFSLALSESNRRKEMRAQAQQPMPQPKVVDKELADMDIRKALPEDLGIAKIPVDMNMASGGIVAFNNGGMSHYARGGNAGEGFTNEDDSDAFKYALSNTLTLEGGLNKNDPVGGLTKYGISQKSYPKLDIAKLTPADAAAIYKKDYWDKIGGDEIAAKDPKLAALAFDTAVQHGVSGAKDMLSQSGDDPAKLLQVRSDKLKSLVQSNPEKYGPQASGWANRIAKLAYTLAPGSTAQAATPTDVSSSGGDRVSDQTLSDLITGKPQPAPQAGPSATVQGVRQALMTKEGAKRAGIGALEDSTIGIVGMPSDISRTMPTSPIPILRGLGTAADYLKSQFAPNAASDIGTTPYLKRKATEAGIRPEDSTDPNLRAIQSGGELAGYFVNPINAFRSGAGKIGNAIREGRIELKAMGLQDIADKKAAVAAAARAEADAATKSANQTRMGMNQPPVAPTRPVTPGVAPSLTPQPAGFPVSEEALLLKQQQQAAAAARGSKAPPPPVEPQPSLGAKVELDKMAAAQKARLAAGLEKDAATAKAMADAKRAEAANIPPTAAGAKSVIASSGQVLARNTGKESFPSVSMEDGSEGDMAKETQSLANRYPAPPEPPPPINYDEGVGRRDAGYGSTNKQIVAAAKEALPKSEDTDGWSKNDWLQFGLAMMAGQSPFALSNVGAAGLAVISAKAEKAREQNKLDIYKSVHGEKPGQSIQIAERLMAADPNLSFEDALARATELTGGATKEALAATRANAVAATNLKNFEAAKEKLDARYSIYMNGTGPTAQAAQKRYDNELQKLYAIHSIPVNTAPSAASALGWGQATKQ